MAVDVVGLLIIVQLLSFYVTGSVTSSMVCGSDWVTYSNSLEEELFYINGQEVDKVSFCKALEYYKATECFSDSSLEEWGKVESNCNVLKLSLVELPQRAGRKILLGSGINEFTIHQLGHKSNSKEESHNNCSFLASKAMVMAVPGMILLCCVLLCPCFRPRRKETGPTVLARDPSSVSSMEGSSAQMSRIELVNLNLSQIIKATNNFSPLLKLGEGDFGTVYKARLQDGHVVAIKRAKKENFNTLRDEFVNEVQLLAKIEHQNLVKLLGYVNERNEHIIITEYVPNGTLREHLDVKHGKILDFNRRLEISIDIAHALTYLHLYAERPIIHRDVKSSNILLTERLKAKVADFGFAKFGPTELDQTHISTKVKGTVGYLDPEYLKTYQITTKSDVFSFGILLLEILTGRRPLDLRRADNERVTIRWAFKNYNEGKLLEMLDPLMDGIVDADILLKMFGLAFQCAAPTRSDRPDMTEVVKQLWSIRMDYIRSVKRE